MKRNVKALLVSAALLLALVLTVTRRDAYRLGLGAGQPLHATPAGAFDKRHGDLSALRVFNSTLMKINDQYVDPTRIDPKTMLLQALDMVQKNVAEVIVEQHAGEGRVTVRVDTASKDFDIRDVEAPWQLAPKMREIFRFVAANLLPGTDTKDIEYAAVNGMLGTLDPHSVLLDPTTNNEMKLTTRGQFGGLGIVIGLHKNQLTVIRPIQGTPASAAGVKAGDRIVRIGNDLTENMMVNDAVSRLRGDPGSEVDVWMQRGDQPARRLVLTRAIISFNTVQAHPLKGGVAYVRVSGFSGNTYDEMHRALEEMKQKAPLKGIILDLRNDPGGLLDQAIKITDEFVDSGTIVTTVGFANRQRDEKRASAGNQPHVPMVVLVNGQSASASEIVAGALKNLDRAVVIGSRTFGKGSVQMLFDNDDGSALKLTTAQYLTPGDVSIQSVGIVPDVQLSPTAVEKDRVWLFRQSHSQREQDLEAHLTSRNARTGDKPIETLRYLAERPLKKRAQALQSNDDDDEAGLDSDDDEPADNALEEAEKFVEDFEITLARELVTQARGWRRREILASSKPFFMKKAADEEQRIAAALTKLGVDWSTGGAGVDKPQLEARLETDRPGGEAHAGETIKLKLTVRNAGQTAAYRVRGITQCDNVWLSDLEFMIGKLAPGESRSSTVPVKLDRSSLTQLAPVSVEVFAEDGAVAVQDKLNVKVAGIARPRFAYSYQLIDDLKNNDDNVGNGDGVLQIGERARVRVTIKNVGDGKSFMTLAHLTSKVGDGVRVNKGRFSIDNMAPGESRTIDFTFDVTPDLQGDMAAVEMDIFDTVVHELVTEKLQFPVQAEGVTPEQVSGAVVVTSDEAELRASVSSGAVVLGRAPRGTVLRIAGGRYGDTYRIELEPGRPAFVRTTAVTAPRAQATGDASKASAVAAALQVIPPRISLDTVPLLVDGQNVRLRGSASDEKQVTDMFVFVSNRTSKIRQKKVFYLSNRKSSAPNKMSFEAEVPLWPGANVITVVARESNQVQAQQTLIVQGAAVTSGPRTVSN